MNQPLSTAADVGAIRYMLGFEGPADQIASLRARIEGPIGPGETRLSRCLLPPVGIVSISPFALPLYYLLQNSWEAAAAAFDDVGEEPELAALLRDPSRRCEAQTMLNARHGLRLDAGGVADIRSNIRSYGAVSPGAWCRRALGRLDKGVGDVSVTYPSETVVTCSFTAQAVDEGVASRLYDGGIALAVGQILVNPSGDHQAYTWFPQNEEPDESGSQALHEAEFDYLRKPPPCLAHFF